MTVEISTAREVVVGLPLNASEMMCVVMSQYQRLRPPEESPAGLASVGPVVAVTAGLGPAHLTVRPLQGRGGAPVAKLTASLASSSYHVFLATQVIVIDIHGLETKHNLSPINLPLVNLIG